MFSQTERAPLHLILQVLALVMFGIAAFFWIAPEPWPWREKFIAAGLFFLTLSLFI
jgi:hypothetical protein